MQRDGLMFQNWLASLYKKMVDAKYTSKGLPVVSEETIDSFMKAWMKEGKFEIGYGRREPMQLVGDVLERFGEENPYLNSMVDAIVTEGLRYGEVDERTKSSIIISTLYGILEAQAEANMLEEKLGT